MPKEIRAVKGIKTEPKAAMLRHENLIDVGVELMRKNGYCATGLLEILETAGVPKGSFYHRFHSKEEFTAAVIERYMTREEKRWQEILNNAQQAPLGRLRSYFEELIRTVGMSAPIQGCLIGSLSVEVAGSSEMLQRCLGSTFKRWQTAISVLFLEAIVRGDLPQSTNPDTLADFVLNYWQGALVRTRADRSDAPLQNFLHYIFEGCFHLKQKA